MGDRRRRNLRIATLATSLFASTAARAQEQSGWSIEPSVYLLLAGLTGTVGIGPIDVDLSQPSEAVWDLNAAFMGSVRVAYRAWAFNADVMYADLGATKNDSHGSLQELIFEPTVSYRVYSWLEPLVGIRYDDVGGDISGPFGSSHAAKHGWVDPIVGVNLRLPLSGSVDLIVRGDVGGFGVGSNFTWQAYPHVSWEVSRLISLQAGYRVLSVDYETGSGADRLKFDIVELGPQLGITFHIDV